MTVIPWNDRPRAVFERTQETPRQDSPNLLNGAGSTAGLVTSITPALCGPILGFRFHNDLIAVKPIQTQPDRQPDRDPNAPESIWANPGVDAVDTPGLISCDIKG